MHTPVDALAQWQHAAACYTTVAVGIVAAMPEKLKDDLRLLHKSNWGTQMQNHRFR